MGQIKNIKLHIVTDIRSCQNVGFCSTLQNLELQLDVWHKQQKHHNETCHSLQCHHFQLSHTKLSFLTSLVVSCQACILFLRNMPRNTQFPPNQLRSNRKS